MMLKLFAFTLTGLLSFSAFAGLGAEIPEASCSEKEKEKALDVALNYSAESSGSFEYDHSIFILFSCNETKYEEVKLSWISEWLVKDKWVRRKVAGRKRPRWIRKTEFIYPPAYLVVSARSGDYILEDFDIEVTFEGNRVIDVKKYNK